MLKPGTVIGGRYRLRYLIAEGGMAEVYLAETIGGGSHNQLIALKRLLPNLKANPALIQMFAEEAKLTLSLKHPNIIVGYEFIEEGGDFYLVMEYVVGKEISGLLVFVRSLSFRERLSVAVSVGLSVGQALAYLEQQGSRLMKASTIVHGDISPQNIMITGDGVIKLYDFGAAQRVQAKEIRENEIVAGNFRYMSPEQLVGEPLDGRSDIFSLSLVLLEIISGPETLTARLGSDPKSDRWDPIAFAGPRFLQSPRLRYFFSTALAFDPKNRFLRCQEMLEELSAIAKEIDFDDMRGLLEKLVGNSNPPALSKKAARERKLSVINSAWIFTLATGGLGLLVWAIVSICTDAFDTKHTHSVPNWPEETFHKSVLDPEVLNQTRLTDSASKEEQKTTMGTLSLVVKPWANVFIDGRFFGATPMASLSLPAGKYLVQLRNPDLSAVALRMVKIYADRKTELVHSFSP